MTMEAARAAGAVGIEPKTKRPERSRSFNELTV
jgi:hypothetical protein